MVRFSRGIALLTAIWILAAAAWVQAAPAATVQKVRFHQTQEKVRLVFDMTAVPDYNVVLEQDPLRLLIELPAGVDKAVLPQVVLNDPFVASLQVQEIEPGRIRVAVNLNMPVGHKVFKLAGPNRLVVDLFKVYDQRVEQEIAPGIKYTSWLRTQPFGPVKAHILLVDPKAGYTVRPVLSNGAVQGLETLTAMGATAKAVAAVNGSYFAPNGDIIGVLKIDGEVVSTPAVARTAVGVMPDGWVFFGQPAWQGYVEVPGGRVGLSGVNRSRGEDELILYTGYYGPNTGTNQYGVEFIIGPDGRVSGISRGSSPIGPGSVVLSAHGAFARELAHLKVGDRVSISQTLGKTWDDAVHILGAGPTLVRDGSVYLTTKTEEFGSDVAGGRAPRTAFGVTADGRLLFVVVDGRQPGSTGLSLLELALFMQELGATVAMNLDGGGSSELVVNDKVMNKPSDGRERRMGSALAVVPRLAN